MNFSIIKQVLCDAWRGTRMLFLSTRRDKFGHIAPTAMVFAPFFGTKENIYLYDNVKIGEGSIVTASKGKFIMKANSHTGWNLNVICQNHSLYDKVGCYPGCEGWSEETANDVICEEEVWIGQNVTLCPGVHLGRGCVIAAGSVCIRNNEYPPYSVGGVIRQSSSNSSSR